MAELSTVANYIAAARVLLQDATVPYRYPDTDIVQTLNFGISEVVRVRPDLFFREMRTSGWIPAYSSGSPSTSVSMDARYRTPLLLYIVGMVQLRDDEATQDTRAAALLRQFISQLTVPVA